MNDKLRILMLEDMPSDAELVLRELKKSGLDFESLRVETREAFSAALTDFAPSLILADFKLPAFDGKAALEIALAKCPVTPFIFCTGTLGEETAVEMLKLGAVDFVLKDHLSRLAPAVARALHEAAEKASIREAEARISELKDFYAAILGSVVTGVMVTDRENVVRFVNPAMKRIYGSAEALVGKNLLADFPGKMPEFLAPLYLAARASNEQRAFDAVRASEQEEVPLYLSGWLVPVMKNGAFDGMIVTVEDVSAKKAAEEAAKKSAFEIADLYNHAPCGYHSLDGAEVFVRVNDTELSWTGFAREEMLGKIAFSDLLTRRSLSLYRECAQKLRRGSEIKGVELEMTRKDGSLLPVLLNAVAVFDSAGQFEQSHATIFDISERKASEMARRRLASIVEYSSHAIIGMALDGTITSWNMGAEKVYGYRSAEIVGKPDISLVPATLHAETNEFRERVRRGESIVLHETKRQRKDGRVIDISLTLSPIRDSEGGITAMSSMEHDISEKKAADAALRKLNRALKTLSNCNETLVHAASENSLLAEMCRIIVEVGGNCAAWVAFSADEILLVSRFGAELPEVFSIEAMRGTLQTGQSELKSDVLLDGGHRHSVLVLPLYEENRVFGALAILSGENESFGREEIGLLEELSSDLAFGITTLRTREARVEAQERLGRSMESTIQAVAATVEMRDPYTAGHQRRVGQLAAAIGRELALPEEEIRGIHLASIVHDLGKVNIPAEILSRPGRLSEIEYSLIKTHARAGFDILKEVEFPWPIADIVLQHHERLDGSGYPQGLQGSEILRHAKILAVADVVEAMSSHRPYRPGLGREKALDEISIHSGVLYDPDAVAACLRLFREKNFAFEG